MAILGDCLSLLVRACCRPSPNLNANEGWELCKGKRV
jgi:hypothetical protein